jgi:hypothetical protein
MNLLAAVSVLLLISGVVSLQVGPPLSIKRTAGRMLRSNLAMSNVAVDHQSNDPLLLRAALGQEVERTPVWMMRQAGRHMKVRLMMACMHAAALPAVLQFNNTTYLRF